VPRIVTLLAAATEIVAAVGADDELVGVSHECDHPPEVVAGRPVLTRARVGPLAASASVDRSVRRLVADALAVYDVDVELLANLAPDVIVTQDLCRVCAVSLDDVRAAVARVAAKADVALVSLHPRRLDDILDDIARVAAAVGRPAAGARVVTGLRDRVERVRTAASASPRRPRVVTVEWIEPVLLGGLWMPELIELAGGVPLGWRPGRRPRPSRATSWPGWRPTWWWSSRAGSRSSAPWPSCPPWPGPCRGRPGLAWGGRRGCTWPTATPTSTGPARASWTHWSCWPPCCTRAASPTRRPGGPARPYGSARALRSCPPPRPDARAVDGCRAPIVSSGSPPTRRTGLGGQAASRSGNRGATLLALGVSLALLAIASARIPASTRSPPDLLPMLVGSPRSTTCNVTEGAFPLVAALLSSNGQNTDRYHGARSCWSPGLPLVVSPGTTKAWVTPGSCR
jgi:Periplasmic binding protein